MANSCGLASTATLAEARRAEAWGAVAAYNGKSPNPEVRIATSPKATVGAKCLLPSSRNFERFTKCPCAARLRTKGRSDAA
jgi:hypothetical protein